MPDPDPGSIVDQVRDFYNRNPYPPPVNDLAGYRKRWQDENRRRGDFHLYWGNQAYREDLKVLIAGCGTSQAAKHAIRQPESSVVGIDISEASLRHTGVLKLKFHLNNLEIYPLAIENVHELGRQFDKIVCTGVLHHLPDPEAGLRALREVLKPDGVLDLMVYAPYGRVGISMLQEYCRRLGILPSDREIKDLAETLVALPPEHPLARLLAESADFRSKAGLADALLNPQDRAYSVEQLFDLLEKNGMKFLRWLRQAPYMPQCGRLAGTPHAARLLKLPPQEQYMAVELFRGTMLRHSLIAYRDGRPAQPLLPDFRGDRWLEYIPIRLAETIIRRERIPPGSAAVLINQGHSESDLFLPVTATDLSLVQAIDGQRTIHEIIDLIFKAGEQRVQNLKKQACSLFERLWQYDQVVFDLSLLNNNALLSE